MLHIIVNEKEGWVLPALLSPVHEFLKTLFMDAFTMLRKLEGL